MNDRNNRSCISRNEHHHNCSGRRSVVTLSGSIPDSGADQRCRRLQATITLTGTYLSPKRDYFCRTGHLVVQAPSSPTTAVSVHHDSPSAKATSPDDSHAPEPEEAEVPAPRDLPAGTTYRQPITIESDTYSEAIRQLGPSGGDDSDAPPAHSLVVLECISRVLTNSFPGPGTKVLSQTLNFARPIIIGETLKLHLKVLEYDESRSRAGLHTLLYRNNEVVWSGKAKLSVR